MTAVPAQKLPASLEQATPGQSAWRYFCRGVVSVFYRRCEVQGLENLPHQGPVLFCANHANALADAMIVQTICFRPVHCLARSGLFKDPLLRPFLAMQQAVPIYRRQDTDGDTSKNVDSFARCYEMFARGAVLLIFPEGQSHSDSRLRPIKTGAARMALGAKETNGVAPVLLPIGLNFTHKGRFRSSVFIKIGEPVESASYLDSQDEEQVRALTASIQQGVVAVTLNVDNWEELDLLQQIERFFAMRHGKYRQRNLAQRFLALKELIRAHQQLRQQEPVLIERLTRRLRQFDKLCRHWGIRDYHLTVRYRLGLIARFISRSIIMIILVTPLAVWGAVNSIIPFLLTHHSTHRFSQGPDQYDTYKMSAGLVLFTLFWGVQIALVYVYFGTKVALVYAVSLPPATAAALILRRQREAIWENIKVFFLFLRKRKLRQYLEARRKEIEAELARLVRLAKRRHNS